jgi:hypothetical protein
VYEKIEPHLQPFFKTAFPIILQTIGLLHSIYVSSCQKKNSDRSLELQELSYLLQQMGLTYQGDGLQCQKNTFEFQKKTHIDNFELQKEQAFWHKLSTRPSCFGSFVTVMDIKPLQ